CPGAPEGVRRKRGTSKQGIGRSRGGLTSRTVAVTDALGYLVRFVLLPGQAHDLAGMPDLLEGLEFGALIGDRAFDADWPAGEVERRGARITTGRCANGVIRLRISCRNQGVPGDRDTIRQDGRELCGRDSSRCRSDRRETVVNRP
ncbi:MAG: hypothetical protein OXE85_15100, partial [Roseovarius sp.]|nr:hypothetical protein [Roseovarius sp.]